MKFAFHCLCPVHSCSSVPFRDLCQSFIATVAQNNHQGCNGADGGKAAESDEKRDCPPHGTVGGGR